MVKKSYKSIAQLAQELGLTRDAVYKRIKRGEIDASMIGKRYASEADPSKYLSIAQFANEVGVSRIAIYTRINRGQLEAIQVGRNHLIPVESIAEVQQSRLSRQRSRKQKEQTLKKTLITRRHFSVCELADELGLTRDAIYKRIKRGDIAASQVGRNFATRAKEDEYVSIAQLASVLGVSRIAVYKKVKKGAIQAQRVGRNHLISVSYLRKELNKDQVRKLDALLGKKKKGKGNE